MINFNSQQISECNPAGELTELSPFAGSDLYANPTHPKSAASLEGDIKVEGCDPLDGGRKLSFLASLKRFVEELTDTDLENMNRFPILLG